MPDAEIPARLNPTNDPARAAELRQGQQNALQALARQRASLEEGQRRFPDRALWDDILAKVDRVRDRILRWEDFDQEKEDLDLEMANLSAGARSAVARSTGAIMNRIDNVPPEKLDALSSAERTDLFDLRAGWEERKEDFLGVLPIEERRRLEGDGNAAP